MSLPSRVLSQMISEVKAKIKIVCYIAITITVQLRYYATSLLCHPRYYTTFDCHQLNSIENIFTMPPLTLATMPHEVQYCSVLTKQ